MENIIIQKAVQILIFVIAFGLLVFLHELGHYLMSKLFHIRVEEFGFGFPPRAVKLFRFQETDFTLNWIPFGAFVRPSGENDPNVPGGLASAKPGVRLAVLFGGPVMNLLTGIAIFILLFSQAGAPDLQKVLIQDVNAGSPAMMAGIQIDDIVLQVNGETVDSTEKLSQIVRANIGKSVQMSLLRGNQTIQTQATPRSDPPPNQGALGITMTNPVNHINAIQAIPLALQKTFDQGRQLVTLPGMLLSGKVSPDEARMVGPKGIYDIFQATRALDQQEAVVAQQPQPIIGLNTLNLLAILSIALGYTNLLPIPALDGGRILFVLAEILMRRKVPAEYENTIHFIGFVALILLMVFITTQDFIHPIIIPPVPSP